MDQLSRLSGLVNDTAFYGVFVVLASIFGLNRFLDDLPAVRDGAITIARQYARFVAICMGVLAILAIWTMMIPRFTYVHCLGGKWISTSRTGSKEVPESVARHFLWLILRLWSVVIMGGSLVVGIGAGSLQEATAVGRER